VNKKGESLKGFNLNNLGYQPREWNVTNELRPRRNSIEKQNLLQTERIGT
jgi:hypothetical protein